MGVNERFRRRCASQGGWNTSICRGPKGITATSRNRRYNSSARPVRWLLEGYFRSTRLVFGGELRFLTYTVPWHPPNGTEDVICGTHDPAGRIRPEGTSSQDGKHVAENSRLYRSQQPVSSTRKSSSEGQTDSACFSFSCSRRYPHSWREFGRGRSVVRLVLMSMSDQPTSIASALPMVDILPLVLQHLSEDLASLCVCALLNRNSNRAASVVLYRHITFAPPWTRTLDLNEAQKYSVRSQHAQTVREVITHHHRTASHISAAGKHTPLCRTPALCRICKDCGNRGYGRLKIKERQAKPN